MSNYRSTAPPTQYSEPQTPQQRPAVRSGFLDRVLPSAGVGSPATVLQVLNDDYGRARARIENAGLYAFYVCDKQSEATPGSGKLMVPGEVWETIVNTGLSVRYEMAHAPASQVSRYSGGLASATRVKVSWEGI